MTTTITSRGELEALPYWSLVVDATGQTYEKAPATNRNAVAWFQHPTSDGRAYGAGVIELPARLK